MKNLDKQKIIMIAILVLIVLGGFLAFKFGLKENTSPQKADIVVWSLFDDSSDMQSLFESFNGSFPGIKINYYKKTFANYEKELLNALATGQGPDVFLVHNTWLAKHQDKMEPMQTDWMSLRDFSDTFVDVTYNDFVDLDGKIYSLPVWCDTLALLWNKDFFNKENIARPPITWEEFSDDIQKLTIKDENGNILRSGAAIGTARNINRSTDLLALLMLQTGTQMIDPVNGQAVFDRVISHEGQSYKSGEEALRFYTDFADPQKSVYTWNNQKDYSIDAFAEGGVAMIFNYAYNLPTIEAKASHLNFGIAEVPQPANTNTKKNYANYWSFAVSRTSLQKEAAWTFVWWLAQKENAQKYLEIFNRPSARRDLIEQQKGDSILGVFASQALSAQSWRQPDSSAVEQIFAEMIEEVNLGKATVEEAVGRAASRVNLLVEE